MEILFYSVSFALFVLAILAFGLVVRDSFQFLPAEEQNLIRTFGTSSPGPPGFGVLRFRDGALRHAWDEHVQRFPNSRKRLLFAAFLVTAAISVMGYPLWSALSSR
jgi:hypothetical protein